ncbi:Ankyrin repeat-containing protein AKR1 [Penaeus vannamei]|uniref:Ankyrin repeat-containing protein AKR1 n=1 Tax=Penaeus vannamei TaxID=6689 RepID=A0A3R7MKH5_PENVA|nr:Ankyrin repeat-containing protein AKR1 [Penaeus vannamei]
MEVIPHGGHPLPYPWRSSPLPYPPEVTPCLTMEVIPLPYPWRSSPCLTHEKAHNTAIIWAASTGHLGALEALAAGGADVNLANNADNTPLHYAAARGYLLMVGALIGLGASSSRKNKEGKTPQEMLGTGPADRLFCLAQECAAAEKERRKMQDQLAEAQSCESEAMAHEAETEDLKGRTADPQERIAALQRQFKKQEEKVKNLLSSMEDFRLKEIQPPGDDQASASGRRKSSRLASRSGTARRDRQSTGSSGKRNTPALRVQQFSSLSWRVATPSSSLHDEMSEQPVPPTVGQHAPSYRASRGVCTRHHPVPLIRRALSPSSLLRVAGRDSSLLRGEPASCGL